MILNCLFCFIYNNDCLLTSSTLQTIIELTNEDFNQFYVMCFLSSMVNNNYAVTSVILYLWHSVVSRPSATTFLVRNTFQIKKKKSYIYSKCSLISEYVKPGVVVVVIVWQLDLQIPVQSVPITTDVVSSNPIHGEMYSIQNYVIKFGRWLSYGTLASSIKKTDRHDIAEILLKVALNTITLTQIDEKLYKL